MSRFESYLLGVDPTLQSVFWIVRPRMFTIRRVRLKDHIVRIRTKLDIQSTCYGRNRIERSEPYMFEAKMHHINTFTVAPGNDNMLLQSLEYFEKQTQDSP